MTESRPFVILLIEMDDEARPLFQYNLNRQGYEVIMTLSEEDAFERVREGRASPDLILINQVDRSIAEFMAMGRRIRSRAGLPKQTPVVVIAERYEASMEGQNIQVQAHEFVTYLEDAQQLWDLLERLCQSR